LICAGGASNLLQLMMKASNGKLCQTDDVDCSVEYPLSLGYPPEEEYFGGVESLDDADSSDDDVSEDDATEAAEKTNTENISEIDDSIRKEDFLSGRDNICDSWELGIDDIDMNETENDGDIAQDFQLLNSFGALPESSEQGHSCCFEGNVNPSTNLLGGCGCQHLEIAQEISQKHIDQVKHGFQKR
jgi:hypothetical protein